MSDARVEELAALGRAAGKSVGSDVRELGVVSRDSGSPERSEADEALAAKAREILRDEVARLTRMRAEFAHEKSTGAPARSSPRLDSMAAVLEGASRFALRMGLITPGEAREIWTEARAAGVHARPAQGHDHVPTELDERDSAHGNATREDEGSTG